MAEIRVNATGGLKLYDADDSHYAQIVAGTITSNVDAITLGHDTVTIADNLSLGSDSAILKIGADGDATLTHDGTTGLTIAATPISIDSTGEQVFSFEDLTKPFEKEIYDLFKNKWPHHEILNIKAVLSVVLFFEALKNKKASSEVMIEQPDLINKCAEALITFKRLKHRFEILGLRNGITYINDSKSTNISSLLTAIKSAEKSYGSNKVVLICGGDSKHQDFSKISKKDLDSTKKILIYGSDKEKIFKAIGEMADCSLVADLEEAINQSNSFCQAGDVVLLSPSCASTDMFLDFRERGDKFRELTGFN